MSFLKKISIGTAQFGLDYGINNYTGQIGFSEAEAIIEESYRSNIRSIDTAISYGNAESVIGNLDTKEFEITTKFPDVPDNVKKVDIIIPPKIVDPTANLDASPAPGPKFPITSGNIAIIVLIEVIIIGLNLRLQASFIEE